MFGETWHNPTTCGGEKLSGIEHCNVTSTCHPKNHKPVKKWGKLDRIEHTCTKSFCNFVTLLGWSLRMGRSEGKEEYMNFVRTMQKMSLHLPFHSPLSWQKALLPYTRIGPEKRNKKRIKIAVWPSTLDRRDILRTEESSMCKKCYSLWLHAFNQQWISRFYVICAREILTKGPLAT